MKRSLAIGLLFLAGTVFSQNRPVDFSYIDRKVQSIADNDPAQLSHLLTKAYPTDIEKVRAIFRWITEHIAYYKKETASRRKQRKLVKYQFPEPEDTSALQPVTERVAQKVLQDRKAVCEGYARLFKSLCDHAGIRSEIITGYARSEPTIVQSRFRSNHSWNAVYIDSNWYLLDVTWASGVIIFPTGEFLKYFDEYYFLTPPDKFIKHHYPDDLRWTLLSDPPLISEYRITPFRQRSFAKYSIVDFSPSTGIIEAAIGDTIQLELETEPPRNNMSIASDSIWESVDEHNPFYAFVHPASPATGTRLKYIFPVVSEQLQWLHVMYNNDAVLRYRVKIKKELAKGIQPGTN